MNRLRLFLLAAVFPLLPASTVWSAPVPAARSALEQVPDTAPLVFHLRGIQGTHDRLVALMKQVMPDLLDKYQTPIDAFFEKGPDNALKGRKLNGLAKDGSHFLIFTEMPKPNEAGVPKVAIILTVSSYKEFREGILTEDERKNAKNEGNGIESANFENTTTYFVDRKGYAVITPDKEVAETFTKKIAGLHNKLKAEFATKLLASDLGIYVNMDTINKDYADEIKQAKQGIEQLIALGAAGGDEKQKQGLELIKNALPHIFQTIEDMQSLLLTFELRPVGLALNLQGEMKEGSTTANLLQDARPVTFDELKRLPRDRSYYAAIKASAGLFKNLGGLISGLPIGGDNKESAKLVEELSKAGPSSILMGGSFPMEALHVYHYDNPAKAIEAQLKMYRKMDAASAKLKEAPVIKDEAEKFGDFKFHSVQLTWDLDKIGEQAAAKGGDDAKQVAIESFKNTVGEKTTMWLGTDGKAAVQIMAPDWKTARALLEQYSKGTDAAGEVKAFREVRKELPGHTSFLVLFDPLRVFGGLAELIKAVVPAGQLPPGWPKMPAKAAPLYVGLALTLQPNRGGLDLFLAGDAAKEFYKVVIQPLIGE